MRRALTMLAAVVALPLLADETAKKSTSTATEKPAPTVISAPAEQADSPLVAAARRTNRLGKKPTNVITNQNLVKANSGSGHVTTTTDQRTLTMPAKPEPPRPTPEMKDAAHKAELRKDAETLAQQKAAKEEARKQRTARAAANAEDEMLDDPDADAERDLNAAQAEKKPPQF